MVAGMVGKYTRLIKGYSGVFAVGLCERLCLPAASQPQDVLEEKHLQDLQKSFTATFMRRGNIKGCLNAPSIEGKSVALLFFLKVSVFGKVLITMLQAEQHMGHLLPCRMLSNTDASRRKKEGAEKQFFFFSPPIYNNFLIQLNF